MAKIELNTELKDFRDQPIKFQDEDRVITVGEAVLLALKLPHDEDRNRKLDSILDGHIVADAVSKAIAAKETEIELDTKQISYVIERAAKTLWFNPVLVGRLVEILDPARLKKSA